MQALFHLAASVDALLAAITTAWAALGEIITAGALLLALGRFAAAIRFTYRCGHAVGTAWFRFGRPSLLATADFISWLNSQIDWRLVAQIVIEGLTVVAVAAWMALQWSHRTLIQCSAALGQRYSSLLVAKPAAAANAVILLRDCGLSQRAIAKELGISRSAVRRELALAW